MQQNGGMQRIVVTGSTGQLGGELCRQLGKAAIALPHAELELIDRRAVRRKLRDLQPAVVINAAAFTNVDLAEEHPDVARAVNVSAVKNLADACRENGCPLVQISTDYVFGQEDPPRKPCRETDPTDPRGVYAVTKHEGEQAAAQLGRHLIVRTCGLYASPADAEAKNFVNTVLRFAGAGRPLSVVDDQHCTPSYVPHVARAILFLTREALRDNAAWGVYHVANRGETTWFEFAQEVCRLADIATPVRSISTEDYGAAAPRPCYSVLDTSKFQALGGPETPTWQKALAERFAAQEPA